MRNTLRRNKTIWEKRKAGMTYRALTLEYNLSEPAIRSICNRMELYELREKLNYGKLEK